MQGHRDSILMDGWGFVILYKKLFGDMNLKMLAMFVSWYDKDTFFLVWFRLLYILLGCLIVCFLVLLDHLVIRLFRTYGQTIVCCFLPSQDSPVFKYINSLSPIELAKFRQTDNAFNSLAFLSPSSLFPSPQISCHRESRFSVKR